jgi:hypothetical protein
MSEPFFRLAVDGRLLPALFSSSQEAINQAILVFGDKGVSVHVLSPEGEICWPASSGRRDRLAVRPARESDTSARAATR